MSHPDYLLARAHKWWVRTAGDLTLNNTAWTAAPTVATLATEAEVGDDLAIVLSGTWGNEAVDAFLDAHTGANYFASAGGASGEGIPNTPGPSGAVSRFSAFFLYTVQAGDLSSGIVTVTLRYRTATATNKTLRANANHPLQASLWNIGPVDPY